LKLLFLHTITDAHQDRTAAFGTLGALTTVIVTGQIVRNGQIDTKRKVGCPAQKAML